MALSGHRAAWRPQLQAVPCEAPIHRHRPPTEDSEDTMGDILLSRAHGALYANLASMLRRSWRRAAAQPRGPARHAVRRLRFGAFGLGVALLLAGAAAAAPGFRIKTGPAPAMQPSHDSRHAEAMRWLQDRHYAAAYGRFAELADRGHAPSALMALTLVRHGGQIYGSEWSATPGQLQRWSTLALQDLSAQAPALWRGDGRD